MRSYRAPPSGASRIRPGFCRCAGRPPFGRYSDAVASGQHALVVGEVVGAEHPGRDRVRARPHLLHRDHVGCPFAQPLLESATLRRTDSVDVEGRDPHERTV
ncbi:hypothetical protein GCM10023094_25900 [Rhodococcus olei]|uniref:Uncharacterized protein n=1 Tax=Rhodococcus olei TaxID=2161675 RepID=A0ABP8P4L6_9NOCA